MGGFADSLHQLSNLIGDSHDYEMLKIHIAESDDHYNENIKDVLFAIINLKINELNSKAAILGEQIYYEKPGAFIKRIEKYWDACIADQNTL